MEFRITFDEMIALANGAHCAGSLALRRATDGFDHYYDEDAGAYVTSIASSTTTVHYLMVSEIMRDMFPGHSRPLLRRAQKPHHWHGVVMTQDEDGWLISVPRGVESFWDNAVNVLHHHALVAPTEAEDAAADQLQLSRGMSEEQRDRALAQMKTERAESRAELSRALKRVHS